MQSLDNISRLREIPLAEFEQRHVKARVPVIFQDLFAGQAIAGLNTLDRSLDELGDMTVHLSDDFGSIVFGTLQGSLPKHSPEEDIGDTCTFREYLNLVTQFPEVRKTITVNETPAELYRYFDIPPYCGSGASTVSRLFLGRHGDVAHLHFDTDGRDVLLYQVFGHKRVAVIPVDQADKLAPVANYSTVFLDRLTECDRRQFLGYTHAWECVLGPGEALFIPKLMWHAVDYLDTTLSFNLRFAGPPNPYLQFLIDSIHRNYLWQGIAVCLSDRGHVEDRHLRDFLWLAWHCLAPAKDARDRFNLVQDALKVVYRRGCCAGAGRTRVYFDFEQAEFQIFPKPSWYYIPREQLRTGPDSNCRAPAEGAISPAQLKAVDRWCSRSERHRCAIKELARDLFGGRDPRELSKEEARRLLHVIDLA